ALPAGIVPGGVYVEEETPFANGAFVPGGVKSDHWTDRFGALGNGLNAVQCYANGDGATYLGSLPDRTWTATSASTHYRGAVNDDASIVTLTNLDGGSPKYFIKMTKPPATFCSPIVYGNGPHHALALSPQSSFGLWPVDKDDVLKDLTVTTIDAG